jgi:hypothetical protein
MGRERRLRRCLGWFRRPPGGDEKAGIARMHVTLVVHDNGDRLVCVRNTGPETAIGVSVTTGDLAAMHDTPVVCRTGPSIPVGDLGAEKEWTLPLFVGLGESGPELCNLTWIDGEGYHAEQFIVPSVEFCDDCSPVADDPDS